MYYISNFNPNKESVMPLGHIIIVTIEEKILWNSKEIWISINIWNGFK